MVLSLLGIFTGFSHQNQVTKQAYEPFAGPTTYYNVTFSEVGLPVNTTWYVDYPGVYNGGSIYTYNTTANTSNSYNHITYYLSNGSYEFYVPTLYRGVDTYVPNYNYSTNYVSVIVSGNAISHSIVFTNTTHHTIPLTYYTVTFSLHNLPTVSNGSVFYWGVCLYTTNGNYITCGESYNSSLVFTSYLPNGTYSYYIYHSSGQYEITPYCSYFGVNGNNVTVNANYVKTPLSTYHVYAGSFTESGLPSGYLFTVNIYYYQYYSSVEYNSTITTSANTSIGFFLPNGTYYYWAYAYNQTFSSPYISSEYRGSITVNGSSFSETISYSQISKLSFNVTDSKNVTSPWCVEYQVVNINTGDNYNCYTDLSSCYFVLPNGVYYYYITVVYGNYKVTPTFGEATINNDSVNVNVTATFERQYSVTLIENGIPLPGYGYYWNVLFTGKDISYNFLSDTNNVATFSVPNGTYSAHFSYYFNVPFIPGDQFSANPSTITVSGHNITLNVTYSPTSGSGSSNALATIGIPLAVGAVGVLAGAGVAVMALRRRVKAP